MGIFQNFRFKRISYKYQFRIIMIFTETIHIKNFFRKSRNFTDIFRLTFFVKVEILRNNRLSHIIMPENHQNIGDERRAVTKYKMTEYGNFGDGKQYKGG